MISKNLLSALVLASVTATLVVYGALVSASSP